MELDECFICGDDQHESIRMVKLQCGKHIACPPCLKKCFDQAQLVQSNYPPKCCQIIDIEHFASAIPQAYVQKYRARVQEFACPPAARLYCRQCHTFINTSTNPKEPLTCSKCQIIVCAKCGGKEHQGSYICHPETMDKELQDLVKKEGWKCCPNCSAVIELRDACNHVTCGYCGHAICYSCGLKWPCPSGCASYGGRRQPSAAAAAAVASKQPLSMSASAAVKHKQVPPRYMDAKNSPVPLRINDPRNLIPAPGVAMTERHLIRMEEAAIVQIGALMSLGQPLPRHLQEFWSVMAATQDPANRNRGESTDQDNEESTSDNDRPAEATHEDTGEAITEEDAEGSLIDEDDEVEDEVDSEDDASNEDDAENDNFGEGEEEDDDSDGTPGLGDEAEAEESEGDPMDLSG